MTKSTQPELTRLHYLTDEEADLILNLRCVSAENKITTMYLVKSLAEGSVKPTTGNVVSIARPAD